MNTSTFGMEFSMQRIATRLPVIHRPRKSFPARVLNLLLRLDGGYRETRRMAELDDHLRRDIGLPAVGPSHWDAPTVMRK